MPMNLRLADVLATINSHIGAARALAGVLEAHGVVIDHPAVQENGPVLLRNCCPADALKGEEAEDALDTLTRLAGLPSI